MSGLTAWAQCMSPHTAALGLYWKNMWYMPFQKIGPLGSFIQFFAGSRWNWGRSGSAARRDCRSSSLLKNLNGLRSFACAAVASGAANNFPKNSRRDPGLRTFLLVADIREIPRFARNDERWGLFPKV